MPRQYATVAGIAATVQFAGGAPNLVAGVIQVNVRIPTGIASLTAAPLPVRPRCRASYG